MERPSCMKSARWSASKLVRSMMMLLPAVSPRRAAATHIFRLPGLPPRTESCEARTCRILGAAEHNCPLEGTMCTIAHHHQCSCVLLVVLSVGARLIDACPEGLSPSDERRAEGALAAARRPHQQQHHRRRRCTSTTCCSHSQYAVCHIGCSRRHRLLARCRCHRAFSRISEPGPASVSDSRW